MPIIRHILAAFSGGPYYVRLCRNRLTVRDATGGGFYDDEPLVALSDNNPPMIEAIGANARSASNITINPFSHPRVFIADFLIAEKVLLHAFKIVSGGKPFRVSPIAVVHITEELDGGLTQIEYRALRELFDNAGARRTYFWDGKELSDEELRNGMYLKNAF